MCLIFLTVKYHRDIHIRTAEGGENATKANLPKSNVSTQTFNGDLIWQISTEENVSYNLMTDHAMIKKKPPNKKLPVPPVVNHSQLSTNDSTLKFIKAAGEKKSKKRPPPTPRTTQVADLMQQIENGPTPKPPAPAPKPTKIADLMKRFEN